MLKSLSCTERWAFTPTGWKLLCGVWVPLSSPDCQTSPCPALHPILLSFQGELGRGLRLWTAAGCGGWAGLGLHLLGFAERQARERMDITLDLRRRSGARGEEKLPVNTVKRPPQLHFLDGCPAPRGPPYAPRARRPSRLTGPPPHNSRPSPPGPRPHPTPPPGPRPLPLPHAPAVGTAPARPRARGGANRPGGRGGAGRGWAVLPWSRVGE